jgi:hypothetical protein
MPNYLSLSPDAPLSEDEIEKYRSYLGQFILKARDLRKIIQSEPNMSTKMENFRVLIDFVTFYNMDNSCKKFTEFIKFQKEYNEFKKWKKITISNNQRSNNQRSNNYNSMFNNYGSSNLSNQNQISSNVNSNPYLNNWMALNNNNSGNNNNSDNKSIGNESSVTDFDDMDKEKYEIMLDSGYDNVIDRSSLYNATMCRRTFYTNLNESESDYESDNKDELIDLS